MKTIDEARKLFNQWLADPCWDVEETEGFEDWHDQLYQWHKEQAAKWDAARTARLQALSEKLGVPGNLALAEAFEGLKDRIKDLEWRQ